MIEITIAQAIVVAFALIVATIVIAQPFRKKVNYMKLETPEIRILAASIIRELNEVRLGEHVLVGIGRMLESMTPNSVVAFPRKDMEVKDQIIGASFGFIPRAMDTSKMKPIGKLKNVRLEKGSIIGEFVPTPRKSRAGEIRKPSTLPKNATAEEKRRFKNRIKTREYRAKKRAALNK